MTVPRIRVTSREGWVHYFPLSAKLAVRDGQLWRSYFGFECAVGVPFLIEYCELEDWQHGAHDA